MYDYDFVTINIFELSWVSVYHNQFPAASLLQQSSFKLFDVLGAIYQFLQFILSPFLRNYVWDRNDNISNNTQLHIYQFYVNRT